MRRKSPLRIQMDAAECGAACLGIILEYYGRYVSPAILRQKCGVSRSGSRAANIVRAAKYYGLTAGGHRISARQIGEMPLPAIVHWRDSHFVVVEGLTRNAVYINDPASGHRVVSWREFEESFSGVILCFSPSEKFSKGGRKPGVAESVTSRLRKFAVPILYSILAALLAVVPALFFTIGCRVFVDEAIVRQDGNWVRPLLWVLLFATLFQAALFWMKATCLRRLKAVVASELASKFLDALFNLPLIFYSQRFSSELANRIRLNDRTAQVLAHELLDATSGMLAAIVFVVVLFMLSPSLAAITLGLLVVSAVLLTVFAQHRVALGQQLASSEGQLMGTSIEAIESIETIKSCGMQSATFSKWHHFFRATTESRQRIEASNVSLVSLSSFSTSLATTAVIGLGGYWVIQGQITLGTLVAFQVIAPLLTTPVQNAVHLFGQLQTVFGDLVRLDDVLDGAAEEQSPATAGNGLAPEPDRLEEPQDLGELVVDNLQFGFNAEGTGLLNCISFTASPGKWIGITGTSGCGKTTLARLVAGLYPLHSGTIRWNAKEISDWSRSSMQQAIGYADQETVLLEGTLRENLCFPDRTHTDAKLLSVCQQLNLIDLLQSLDGGLGGRIEEGGRNLSGGERQRIDLARLLVNSHQAFILDEATSALDEATEVTVLSALREQGKTTIFVTHRPNVLAGCDEVLFLQDGEIAARGTHAELLDHSPAYAQLCGEEAVL